MLVATVLLQPGKTDAGALFTSNISSSAFSPRGTASILSKITIVAGAVFMVSAFLISLPALQGGVSVLDQVGDTPPAGSTAAPAVMDTDANTDAAQPDANTVEPAADANLAPAEPADAPPANSGDAPANN